MIDQHRNEGSGLLLTDLMMNHQYGISTSAKEVEEDNIIKMLAHTTPMAPISDLQGAGTGKAAIVLSTMWRLRWRLDRLM
ncbi:hypothetical protein L1987_56741 [Smallanthus sonchifolius]|uniref:Uncharacterized protein n=1 Tax=Smallanthus sonchifolius TaxID=185202 RepID=A0ACB9DAL6_9ASTR|nr:hypothetical protein L1987_56741 [Smallanthus sonchifolius]